MPQRLQLEIVLAGGKKVRTELELTEREVDELRRSADGTDLSMRRLGGGAALAGGVLGGLFVGAATAAVGVTRQAAEELFELGSGVQETADKFSEVFGPATDLANQRLAEYANLAGLTQSEGQDLLATIGAVAQGMDFGQQASADYADEILRLSADVASFNNRDTADVSRAITSAITGERESLKGLGIVISEADVQQRALADSGKASKDALTQQERATATLALITERAGAAIGNLALTQDSTANRTRKLAAAFREQREELATKLVPVFDLVLDVVDAFVEGTAGATGGLVDFVADGVFETVAGLLRLGSELGTTASLLIQVGSSFVDSTDSVLGFKQELNFLQLEAESVSRFIRNLGLTLNLFAQGANQVRADFLNSVGLDDAAEKSLERIEKLREQQKELLDTVSAAETGTLDEQIAERRAQLDALIAETQERIESIRDGSNGFLDGALAELQGLRNGRKDATEEEREQMQLIARLRRDIQERTLSQIEDGRTRELAGLDAWYQEQQEAAQGNAVALGLIDESYRLRSAEIDLRYREQALEEARAFQEARFSIEQRYAELRGASQEELLQREVERYNDAFADLVLDPEADTSAIEEALLKAEEAELRYSEFKAEQTERRSEIDRRQAERFVQLEAERAAVLGATEEQLLRAAMERYQVEAQQLELRAQQIGLTEEEYARLADLYTLIYDGETEALRLQRSAFEERARLIEGYLNAAFDAVREAFSYERELSDEQIAAERRGFEEREANLVESLRNRTATEAEYEADRKALAADRAAFEEEVRQDQISKTARALVALSDLIKQAALDAIQAELAKAAASAVASLIAGPLGFFGGILAASAAIGSVFALGETIRNTAGFDGGGFVGAEGQRGRDTVPAMLGKGEAVINRHQQAYVQRALVNEYGFGLQGLFDKVDTPHYLTTGGSPGTLPSIRPDVEALIGGGTVNIDTSKLETLLEAGNRQAAQIGASAQQAASAAERASRTAQDMKANPSQAVFDRRAAGRGLRLGNEYQRSRTQRLGRPNTRPNSGRPPRQ